MSITKKSFGAINNQEVFSYILDNGKGLEAEILTFGGIIRRLVFCDTDVVLGRTAVEACKNDDTYFGALIGRNSNRLEGGSFELGGKKYQLALNDSGRHNLHGGNVGFSRKIWEAEAIDGEEPSLILSLTSPDGEEGFPGTASVKVTYTLTAENSIKIHYEGEADEETILNMTNHSYFNLNGHDSGNICGHLLKLSSSFFTPLGENGVPDGSVLPVDGTPMDFRTAKPIGRDITDQYEQTKMCSGYDHNFALDGRGFRKFAEAEGDKTHIVMECFTDLPAVQLYTANMLDDANCCKGGLHYGMHNAFCLETQVFPNAMKYSHFPSPILKKGEKYDTVTEYKFSKKN